MKNTKQTSNILDKQQGLIKAENFCAYQERSQQEVRSKLYNWGLTTADVEEIISTLIIHQFLNEERFATAYVNGKFRIKKWGKMKIQQGLKLKQVPDKIIQTALKQIDNTDYVATILMLADKKLKQMRESDIHKKKHTLVNYLQSKGFENNLIFDVLTKNNLP